MTQSRIGSGGGGMLGGRVSRQCYFRTRETKHGRIVLLAFETNMARVMYIYFENCSKRLTMSSQTPSPVAQALEQYVVCGAASRAHAPTQW